MADRESKRRNAVAAKERKARALEAEIVRTKRALASLASRDPEGGEARVAERRLADLEERRLEAVRDARRERQLAEQEEGEQTLPTSTLVDDLDRDLESSVPASANLHDACRDLDRAIRSGQLQIHLQQTPDLGPEAGG